MTNDTLPPAGAESATDTGATTDAPISATLGFVQPDNIPAGATAEPSTAEPSTAAPSTTEPAAGSAGRAPVDPGAAGAGRGYLGLWARTPRELGFLLPTLPVVIVAFTVLVTLFSTGVSLVALFVGLFIVVAALYAARGFGVVELTRLRWAGQPAIAAPQWTPRGEPATPLRTILGPLVSLRYWLYLMHGMIVNFIVGVATWSIAIVWVSGALGGLTYWMWSWSLPVDNDSVGLYGLWAGVYGSGSVQNLAAENLVNAATGLFFLVTLPFVTRALVLAHQGIARGMLGAWSSEALQREVADLSASRGAAVSAEDQSLRRLERDIHDGPQQRLVRLQMDLASAERRLDDDPEAARRLLVEAREQARDTLEELRALSRGLVPPILQDRGLIVALESLAARSTVPVRLELLVDRELRLPSEIERSAYFIASELLTNVAKHAGATGIRLHLELRRIPEDDSTWLDLWVIDNGRGGAVLRDGHGLAGLDERLRGLRGVLSVRSPDGGPTAVGAHIPLVSDLGSSLGSSLARP
ncbi:sensor domain-containing protein [Cryobacterium sp. SO2]|uniref:sensor histidine kinase n=1 Tax=Cryobacterium sp. SO2 TaxID=1897060 RepID=UPI00223D5B18|nr:sensor domain-containing protein [Cryobacterium sp. SO2]WEO75827.1 sensor domain-containing protein [Cryobacterium sp. SO2]